MSLVYVTGSAGSGKSTLAIELRRLGLDAYDEDDHGGAHNLRSGMPVPIPPIDERSIGWFSEHEWRLYDGVLERLQTRAADGLVVLCGNVFAPTSAVETFDLVVHLDVDEHTLRERLGVRVDNDYGKSPEEMEQILERHRKLTVACQGFDVVTIDARQPLAAVAGDIVEATARAQGTTPAS